MDNAKKNKKGLFVAGGIAVVAVFASIFLIAIVVAIIVVVNVSKGPRIDLTKYIVFEATGYDGYGETSATIDWDSIEEKYGEKIKYSKKASEWGVNSYDYDSPVDVLKEDVEIILDKQDKVANGDEINYEISINEEYNKYLKCKIKTGDGTYIVEGLEKIDTFNPFDYVTVEFSGISPSGEVKAYYDGEKEGFSQGKFVIDKTSGLKNGDTVKISIDIDDSETVEYGYVIPEKEKVYTVEGLSYWVESYNELNEDLISEISKEAEDVISAYFANSYSNSISEFENVGYVFKTYKNADDYKNDWYSDSYNELYMIYSGVVTRYDDSWTFYMPVRFVNIIGDKEKISYGYDGRFDYNDGSSNAIDLYDKVANIDSDKFSILSGGEFSKYGNYDVVKSLDSISEEDKEWFRNAAYDYILSNYANDYYRVSHSEPVYEGECLLYQKNNGGRYNDVNKYLVVYSVESSYYKENTKIYFVMEYDGLLMLDDGLYVVEVGGLHKGNQWRGLYGFTEGEQMFEKTITINRDKYEYIVSEGLKQYEK